MSRSAPMLMKLDEIKFNLYQNKAMSDVTEARLRLHEYKTLDMETRMLKTNLVFTGISETNGQDGPDAAAAVRRFLEDHLSLDPGDSTVVSAYRVGPRQVARGRTGPRAIVATFSDLRHVDAVMANTNLLKGKPYGVSRDYPREIREARKELWQPYKEARDRYGPRNVRLVYPAALVVHGETVRNLFPRWHEVLRESRNSNTRARTEIRLKDIVDATFRASQWAHGPAPASADVPGSDSDSDSDSGSNTSGLNRGSLGNRGPTDPATKPGYLLGKHPVMARPTNLQAVSTSSAEDKGEKSRTTVGPTSLPAEPGATTGAHQRRDPSLSRGSDPERTSGRATDDST